VSAAFVAFTAAVLVYAAWTVAQDARRARAGRLSTQAAD
jgi:hypothetical protein